MSRAPITSFEEFWPFYLGEHRSPLCRALHFTGSTLALGITAVAAIGAQPWLMGIALLCGYGFAWVGHFFVEKNRPASFSYPLWSFIADWKMWSFTITGKLEGELQRLGISHAAKAA